ncbi:MAG: hypothetical protein KJP04_09310 [Arenicella sp.]|nr:hypothetical protein [Arenicella sp.]
MNKDPLQQADNQPEILPWFRYGMVWMVILLPLLVVVASLITVVIAHNHAPVIIEKSAVNAVNNKNEPYRETAQP